MKFIASLVLIAIVNTVSATPVISASEHKKIYTIEVTKEEFLASCFGAYSSAVVCMPFKDFKGTVNIISWNILSDYTDFTTFEMDGLEFRSGANLAGLQHRSGGPLAQQKLQNFQVKIDDYASGQSLSVPRATDALTEVFKYFDIKKIRVVVAE